MFKFRLPMRFPEISALTAYYIVLVVAIRWPSCGADFVGGAIRFEPPAIVGVNELTRAPDGMPFAGDALGVDCYTDPNLHGFGWLRLQFIWGGVPLPDGRRIKYSMETTNEFFQFIRDASPTDPHRMGLGTFQGLPSVNIKKTTNDTPRQRLHEATFVQVKTNIMFRMSVSAETEIVFDALTASLKTVRIDPEKLYEFIRPKEPKITVVDATTVEIGFAPIANREVLAVTFRTKDPLWSILGSIHFDQATENEIFEKLSQTLNELSNQSKAQGTPLRATLEIHRTGEGRDELQRSIIFHFGAMIRDRRSAQKYYPFSVGRLLNQKIPDGFRKVRELPFKVNLVIEDHSSWYGYKKIE